MDETMLSFEVFEDGEILESPTGAIYSDPRNENHTHKPESEAIELTKCEKSKLVMPSLPEEMDFSWLFQILPPQSPSQPGGDNASVTFNQHNEDMPSKVPCQDACETPKESKMLMNPMLSEMSLNSTFSPLQEMTLGSSGIFTPSETMLEDDDTNSQPKRQFNASTRNRGRNGKFTRGRVFRKGSSITETPILRRSKRKRNSLEMANMHTTPEESTLPNKRMRKAFEKEKKTEDTTSMEYEVITELTNSNPSIKIVFRKCKPVNPINKRVISQSGYQKGLLETEKNFAAELYLKNSISPRIAPTYETKWYVTDAMKATPLNISEIRKRMMKEHIESHNELANLLAHGGPSANLKRMPGLEQKKRKELLMDFVTKDFDLLLDQQQSTYSRIQAQLLDEKANNEHQQTIIADETLNTTFQNFSNFNDYFDDPIKNQIKLPSMVGAVPVRASALEHKANEKLFSNKAIFEFKGKLYRPNPIVIPIVRLSDKFIQEIISGPELPGPDCPYYTALCEPSLNKVKENYKSSAGARDGTSSVQAA